MAMVRFALSKPLWFIYCFLTKYVSVAAVVAVVVVCPLVAPLALHGTPSCQLLWCKHGDPPLPGGSVRRVRGRGRILRWVQVLSVVRLHAYPVLSVKP